jgi:hypothetical protein
MPLTLTLLFPVQVDATGKVLCTWCDWVRLRESSLGVTPASAAGNEDGSDIELPPLSELQVGWAALGLVTCGWVWGRCE